MAGGRCAATTAASRICRSPRQILDSSGTVVRTLQDDEVCRSTSSYDYVYFSWVDALDDADTQVPDGDYTFRAEVTNTYGTSTYDTPVIVDTRVPGAITTPEPGVELSGTVDVVFTAGSDLPLERVRLYAGSCSTRRSLDPDPSGYDDLAGGSGRVRVR